MVSVGYNAEQARFEELAGATVESARLQLRAVLGIPNRAISRVNGVWVGGDYRLRHTDDLEFVVLRGWKGGADLVWMVDEQNRLLRVAPGSVEEHIQKGLRPVGVGNHVECLDLLPYIAGCLGQIEHSLRRIADHVDPPPPNVVATDYVADKLNCTLVWAARMAAEGRIPRSCIVPGTGNGKLWKFYRARIDKWIEER